jgi:hypothetical protein
MPPGPGPRKNQIVTIIVMLGMLVGLLFFKDRCAHGVDSLFKGLDPPNSHLTRDAGSSELPTSDGGH